MSFLIGALLGVFEALQNFPVVVLHHFNPVALVLVRSFVAFDLLFLVSDSSFELFLLIVELVLKSEEMLIERDAIPQKRFIATCLILLVHLLSLEQLDLSLHSGDLSLQVQDDLVVDSIGLLVLLSPVG